MKMPKAWLVLASALNRQLGWGAQAQCGAYPTCLGWFVWWKCSVIEVDSAKVQHFNNS